MSDLIRKENELALDPHGMFAAEIDDQDVIITGLPTPTATRAEPVAAWQRCWREGICPQLTIKGLEGLKRALENNDPRLLQGATTSPPPLQAVQDWTVEKACAICYGGWQGEGLETVGEVEEFFAQTCYEADQRLGEPGGIARFLNWYDQTPREEMRPALIAEIDRELSIRQEASPRLKEGA